MKISLYNFLFTALISAATAFSTLYFTLYYYPQIIFLSPYAEQQEQHTENAESTTYVNQYDQQPNPPKVLTTEIVEDEKNYDNSDLILDDTHGKMVDDLRVLLTQREEFAASGKKTPPDLQLAINALMKDIDAYVAGFVPQE